MARRTTKKKSETQLAVEFIGSLINKVDYCRFLDNELIYNDAIISVGYPVTFSHNLVLDAKAVKSCAAMFDQKATFTIEQTLKIETERKRASIAIGNDDMALYAVKDPAIVDIGQDFVDALVTASYPTRESAKTVMAASVLINHYTAIGTDGHVFIEVFHGKLFDINTFPVNGLRVPTAFILKLKQIKLTPVALGYSGSSLTVHYENGAWVKTQLYLDEVSARMAQVTDQIDKAVFVPFDKDLIDLFRESEKFADTDAVQISPNELTVSNPTGSILKIKTDKQIKVKPCKLSSHNLKVFNTLVITEFDFYSNERILFVKGKNFRGAMTILLQ